MSVLLAMENALEKRIKYVVGNSAVILSLAQDMLESGRISENVNVVVKFAGSEMERPMKSAHVTEIRMKRINFDVTVYYKQTQREGHSFALAMLDVISGSITGYVPDLAPYLGQNTQSIPVFQTGFELMTEQAAQVSQHSIFSYTQTYSILIGLPVVLASTISCPLEYNLISLKDSLPCKRCLKTATGVVIGVAEYTGNCFNGERIFVFDTETCPTRPQDKLDIELGDDLGNGLFVADLIYTPYEAISYDSEGEIVIDNLQVIESTLERYYFDANGNIPAQCLDFTVIFRAYAQDTKPLTSDTRELFFLDDYQVEGII